MTMINRRLGLLFCLFVLLFSVALVRAAWLQGVRGGALRAEAHNQQTNTVTIPGLRGRVLDRQGKLLAVSEDAATVIATPYQVKRPEIAARRLSPLLDVPAPELQDLLDDPESGFAYLAHKVDLTVAEQVRRLEIAGISTIPDSRRIYPQGELGAQVIGAVGADGEGLSGLESSENDVLKGDDGEQEVVHDALGEPIRFDNVRNATVGGDLRLTLDAAIQSETERVLADTGEQYSAKGAAAVVMDPNTGDILALANWPTFDPQQLDQASEDSLLNRATGFTYEPGSTFKAVTISNALEDGIVTPSTSFDLAPTIQVADREIGESHERGPVTLTVAEILAQSSNVGAVTIGLEIGGERFSEWIKDAGFGQPTGVSYPGEEQGIVPSYDDYSGSTMGNLPIGQGLSVTPLQMAAFYAAIANGGVLRTPRLVTQAGTDAPQTDSGERIMSARTAGQVRQMLRGVLAPGGTASEVSVPGYELAGKTGTAQKVEGGTYSEDKYVASFIGFAPAKNPELLVAVIVDEPLYVHTGGAVAAPAFGEIASFALPYLGVPPN